MTHDNLFLATFVATLAGITFFAWGGKTKARNSDEFSLNGRKANSWGVSGAITGTLVGGASTVGTAQLAFLYGLSAWWFTLGAGLACLFLGLFIAAPMRRSQVVTIPQFIAGYYGERARVAASLYSALGMFIQIIAQLLACGALLAVLFDLPLWLSAFLSALLVILFTLGGGMKSAGATGLVKLALIYLTMVTAGSLAYRLAGGWGALRETFPAFPWFSLFGYGTEKGLSDLVSMLVGVVSTQTYLQAVFSARNEQSARNGALLSAVLIPPLGIFGVLVGLYMRHASPDLKSALALPAFIAQHFPGAFAGVAFATLLIASIGTASGLALGVATTLRVDILERAGKAVDGLGFFRGLTSVVVLSACLLLMFNLGSAIMDWSFLSMGLRGATLCLPMLLAIFLKPNNSQCAGMWSIFLAPAGVILAGTMSFEWMTPLYVGLCMSLAIFTWGSVWRALR